MLIRGSAPRCVGMSARETLPPRLGPVSGCIYKKRFTCVCYTKIRNTQVFRVKRCCPICKKYLHTFAKLRQTPQTHKKRTKNLLVIAVNSSSIPPNPSLMQLAMSVFCSFQGKAT